MTLINITVGTIVTMMTTIVQTVVCDTVTMMGDCMKISKKIDDNIDHEIYPLTTIRYRPQAVF